jgi:hypothetical protein
MPGRVYELAVLLQFGFFVIPFQDWAVKFGRTYW